MALNSTQTGKRPAIEPLSSADSIDVSTPATKRMKFDYGGDIVTVVVGAGERKFEIHKSHLCYRSAYFSRALSKEWEKDEDRIIRLPDQDAEAFSYYAHWTYTGLLAVCHDSVVVGGAEHVEEEDEAGMILSKMWVLGDYLGDGTLCDHVVDIWLEVIAKCPDVFLEPATMRYTIDNTSEGSKYRRLLLDIIVSNVSPEALEALWREYPVEVLFELAKSAVTKDPNKGRPDTPKHSQACKYHVHQSKEHCCVKKSYKAVLPCQQHALNP